MPSQKEGDKTFPAYLASADLERLTSLLALLLIKGEPQVDQIRALLRAGYNNTEIARLLGLTPNAVNIAIHRFRKKG